MTEEYLDILNERGEKTGEKRSYAEAHRIGLLHRAVHVWFLNSKKQLLLQKRSKNKFTHPSCWDISVAGHASSGQTSIEAAKRETEEEIGLTLLDEAYEYLFTVRRVREVINKGTYVNNEFQDVFLVHSDISIEDLVLPPDEVEEVRWLDISEFKKWIAGQGEAIVPHDEEYKRLLEHLEVRH